MRIMNSWAIVLLCAMVLSSTSLANMVTLNPRTGNTDVANGILTLDALTSGTSYTYGNVAGAGFDIKVTASKKMVNTTGDLNYTNLNSSLSFEFFAAGTGNPVAVSGFDMSWLDVDKEYQTVHTIGPFSIVDAAGVAQLLDTSDISVFTLGSALSAVDLAQKWPLNSSLKSCQPPVDLAGIPCERHMAEKYIDWAPQSPRWFI